jgi:hypothetical protein
MCLVRWSNMQASTGSTRRSGSCCRRSSRPSTAHPHTLSTLQAAFLLPEIRLDTISTRGRRCRALLLLVPHHLVAQHQGTPPLLTLRLRQQKQPLREFHRQSMTPLHQTAVQKNLQVVRNSTVGSAIEAQWQLGCPRGMTVTDPADAKVLLHAW